MEYITVRAEGADQFVEKKSRFIGSCRPASTEEEALEFISGLKTKYWDASHNVYAYILREGNIQRFSDDGEPQGTAGIPVIEAMKKSGVTDAVVVATRYFGGILLGGRRAYKGLFPHGDYCAGGGTAGAHEAVFKAEHCLLL